MPTLLFRFPGGRYHATPWGHHVNEGLVEWPPSPWRILRALIATGYAKHGWDVVPPVARELIEALSSTLPNYRLPHATVAHTRHYMPTGVLDKGREKTTLVFDTWAEVQKGVLAVRWGCALSDDAARLLEQLSGSIGYLGRSESWVEVDVCSDDATLPPGKDAYPHVDGHRGDRGYEQVPLMAPESPAAYLAWRTSKMEEALQGLSLPSGKKAPATLLKKRREAEEPYPADLLGCLQKDTSWWKAFRWSQPPGSRKVLYWRAADSLAVGVPVAAPAQRPAQVGMMLLALTAPSGSRSALPALTRVLPQAELIHRSLVAHVGRGMKADCPELTGRSAAGSPLKGHRHAHILPADLDGDGRLDHVIIYAPMGLGPDAQQAVRALKRTWTKGGVGDLRVALAGQGGLDTLRSLPEPFGSRVAALLGPSTGASVWTSVTPLVLPRFQKRHGRNALEGQILAELSSRRLPPAHVEVRSWDAQTLPMRHAIRVRRPPSAPPPVDAGVAVVLTFDEPVCGPLSLGYGSHFGLGLFSAAGSKSPA